MKFILILKSLQKKILVNIKMKNWKDFNLEEKLPIMTKLDAIYKKHGYPQWLKKPTQLHQIVHLMMEESVQDQQFLLIEGKCGYEEKKQALEIKTEIEEAL